MTHTREITINILWLIVTTLNESLQSQIFGRIFPSSARAIFHYSATRFGSKKQTNNAGRRNAQPMLAIIDLLYPFIFVPRNRCRLKVRIGTVRRSYRIPNIPDPYRKTFESNFSCRRSMGSKTETAVASAQTSLVQVRQTVQNSFCFTCQDEWNVAGGNQIATWGMNSISLFTVNLIP